MRDTPGRTWVETVSADDDPLADELSPHRLVLLHGDRPLSASVLGLAHLGRLRPFVGGGQHVQGGMRAGLGTRGPRMNRVTVPGSVIV